MEVKPPKLTSYQKDILYSPSRFTITEASTKAGKTHSHIIWLYGMAHQKDIDHEGRHYWWIAPVYMQAKIAFKRFRRNLAKSGLYQFNESDLWIKCPGGAVIDFKSAEKPDNMYGENVYAAVFDEAPRARPEAWYALRSTLSYTKAPAKLIGNFGGISNWVHQLKEKSRNDKEYSYFKVTCWDAIREGILEEGEVLQAKSDLPDKIFKELYEAEASEDEGQLINNESIQKLFSNTHLMGGEKFITADIARLGKDKTIVMVWDNFNVIRIEEKQVSKVNDSVDLIKELMETYNVNRNRTIVDEDGVGGGVVDYVRCVGFTNNATAKKEKGKQVNFANIKSQCGYKLAERINNNEIWVSCNEKQERSITQELEWIRLPKEVDYSKIRLLEKDKIKKQIGHSPDYSDALMMRMYFELRNSGQYKVI